MRPLLVYDGECGFCRRWVRRWQRLAGGRFDVAPYQEVAPRYPAVGEEEFGSAVHLIEDDGTVTRAAEAVFRSISTARGWAWTYLLYRRFPGFAPLSEAAYSFVARHRGASWLRG